MLKHGSNEHFHRIACAIIHSKILYRSVLSRVWGKEGFNDTIIRYEWDFGDGTPKIIKEGNHANPPDPTVDHQFVNRNTYLVTARARQIQMITYTLEALHTEQQQPYRLSVSLHRLSSFRVLYH
jgi:hypothetical protein